MKSTKTIAPSAPPAPQAKPGPVRAFLVPAPDKRRPGRVLTVSQPSGGPHGGLVLAELGQWVTVDHYWRARLRDGDVTDQTSTAPPEEA